MTHGRPGRDKANRRINSRQHLPCHRDVLVPTRYRQRCGLRAVPICNTPSRTAGSSARLRQLSRTC